MKRLSCYFALFFSLVSSQISAQSLFTFEDHFDSITSSSNWHHTQDYRGGGVFEVVDGQFKRTTPGFVFYYNDSFTSGAGIYEFKAKGWWNFLWRGSTHSTSGRVLTIRPDPNSAEYLDYYEVTWSGYDHQYHNGSILRQERKFVGQYLRDSMNTIKIVDIGDSAKIYVNNVLIHNVFISPDWRQDGYIEIGAAHQADLTAFDDITIKSNLPPPPPLFTIYENHFDSVSSANDWHHTQDYRGGGVFEVVDGQFKRTTPGFVFYYNDSFVSGSGTYEFKARGWWVFMWRGSTNATGGRVVLIGSAGSSAQYLDYDEAIWSGYDHQYHNGTILRQERKLVGQYLRDSLNSIKIVDTGDSAKIYVNNVLIHNVFISPDWRQDGYIEIGANSQTDLTAFDDIVISGSNIFPGYISGKAFYDFDKDGIFDDCCGENRIAGLKIFISGDVIDSTYTNLSGDYKFEYLAPGNYTITTEQKSDLVQVFPSAPGVHSVTLADSESVSGKNFGFWKTSEISGVVFNDLNNNGFKEEAESGIADIIVILDGSDRQDSTLTDPSGNYSFKNVFSGNYTLTIIKPVGWKETNALSGYLTVGVPLGSNNLSGLNFGLSTTLNKVKIPLTIQVATGETRTLYWGKREGAQRGIWRCDPAATRIDSIEGEAELPPPPPYFDARFRGSYYLYGGGSLTDMRGIISSTQVDTYLVGVSKSYADTSITFKWSKELVKEMYEGHVILYGYSPVKPININMKLCDSVVLVLSDGYSGSTLKIRAENKPIFQVNFERGWNLVSTVNKAVQVKNTPLFPNLLSKAYSFDPISGYRENDTLCKGTGYWMKFNDAITSVCDTNEVIWNDTINVHEGWNLIGSVAEQIPVNTVGSIPANMVTSSFFAYSNGYYISDTLQPMKAYWVLVNQAGQLILSATSTSSSSNQIRMITSSDLPPAPPSDEIMSVIELPTKYSLEQAYPNPFNPITKIKYQLPEDTRVILKVFNILGEEVKIIVNGFQSAGYKEIAFNGEALPSGFYFYQLQTDKYTDVKKMLLVK